MADGREPKCKKFPLYFSVSFDRSWPEYELHMSAEAAKFSGMGELVQSIIHNNSCNPSILDPTHGQLFLIEWGFYNLRMKGTNGEFAFSPILANVCFFKIKKISANITKS